jgi:hypothetical protein
VGKEGDYGKIFDEITSRPGNASVRREIGIPGDGLLEGLSLYGFPHFGVYVYRSRRLFLAIRCGPVGQNGIGGHAHNDQLSMELNVDGEDWIADPGTYLYTPLPGRRDEYRSVAAHSGPRRGRKEPGRLDHGLFRLGDEGTGCCLCFREDGFAGMHRGFGDAVYRFVSIRETGVSVVDCHSRAEKDFEGTAGIPASGNGVPPFSPGYGLRLRKAP